MMMDDAVPLSEQKTAWLAVDWGTSNLRVWAMSADGEIIDSLQSNRGMSDLTSDQYENVLIKLAGPYLVDGSADQPLPVVVCGMAGSRSGWADAGYIDAPANAGALSGSAISVPTEDNRIAVHIMSGLRQLDPPDVMRGEETQLAGFAASNPGFVGQVCLPGTHSKWVSFNGGRISGNQTVMTGELFFLLRKKSILKLSLADPNDIDGPMPTSAFLEGVERGHEMTGGALGQLFSLRAGDLVGDGHDPVQRLAKLSGLLIGSEFAAVGPTSDLPIIFIGSEKLGPLYRRAALHLGFDAEHHSGEELVLTGLRRAHELLQPAASQASGAA